MELKKWDYKKRHNKTYFFSLGLDVAPGHREEKNISLPFIFFKFHDNVFR